MPFENINAENLILYAAKSYDSPNCIKSEFREDMKRFNYLKRLFRRYTKYGDIKELLIVNHLVVLYNVFGNEATTRMLFFLIREEDYSTLKTFLLFLSFMPERISGINDKEIISSDIPVDMKIAQKLRMIV